jgi:hypothetical protein
MRTMIALADKIVICFAHLTYRLHERFSSLETGINSFAARDPETLIKRVRGADVLVISGLWQSHLLDRTKRLRYRRAGHQRRSIRAAARPWNGERPPGAVQSMDDKFLPVEVFGLEPEALAWAVTCPAAWRLCRAGRYWNAGRSARGSFTAAPAAAGRQDAARLRAAAIDPLRSPLILSWVHWGPLEIVVEVKYLTWTEAGLLRQVAFGDQRISIGRPLGATHERAVEA